MTVSEQMPMAGSRGAALYPSRKLPQGEERITETVHIALSPQSRGVRKRLVSNNDSLDLNEDVQLAQIDWADTPETPFDFTNNLCGPGFEGTIRVIRIDSLDESPVRCNRNLHCKRVFVVRETSREEGVVRALGQPHILKRRDDLSIRNRNPRVGKSPQGRR